MYACISVKIKKKGVKIKFMCIVTKFRPSFSTCKLNNLSSCIQNSLNVPKAPEMLTFTGLLPLCKLIHYANCWILLSMNSQYKSVPLFH